MVVAVSLLGCATSKAARVTSADGPLLGVSRDGVSSYLGVPFAEAPVRFAAPVQNVSWKAERDATAMRGGCAQLTPDGKKFRETSTEDCLHLNVFVPEGATGPLPVMLFFPGGAYVFGANNEAMYEGSKLVRAGQVILVVANYRLGPFGFAAHPALGTANQGLLDQREAMRWVQRNIAAFGGDASNVTIFGESAGAGSVCMHLTSEGSRGLFHRAIMESVPCTAYRMPSKEQAAKQAVAMAEALGCRGDDVATCLRAKTTEEVLRALPLNTNVIFGEGVAWGPTVDGALLVDQPRTMWAAGKAAPVPLIVGANSNEGSLFFATVKDMTSDTAMREALTELFSPEVIDAAIAHYGVKPDARTVAVEMLGDMFFCDTRRIAREHSSRGNPVYRYHFARTYYDILLKLGAFHGSELPFVFGNALFGLGVTALGRGLEESMQGYWTTFARKGDPNGASRPGWTRYQKAGDAVLRLDVPIADETQLRSANCDFWDQQF